MIRKHVQVHLDSHLLLSQAQHGFRRQRSCLSQLLSHYDAVISGLETGGNVDSIYLDFAKAFDSVDHNVLAGRIRDMGITGTTGRWINEYLRNRSQQVLVNDSLSAAFDTPSGVPQGSVIGPLLFLLMIDSLGRLPLNATWLSIFADDTRLGGVVHNEEDAIELQEDLENVYAWQRRSNLQFNSDKFEVLMYGKDATLKNSYTYLTPDCTGPINRAEHVKDLGTYMSSTGNFNKQIEKVCSKVRRNVGWIRRSFITRSYNFLVFMWRVYIQPIIDYNGQLWSPTNLPAMSSIETLQKSFINLFPGLSASKNYWERLSFLKLSSQVRRAERYKVIYTWKILENLVPNCNINSVYTKTCGRMCLLPPSPSSSPAGVRTMRSNSFQVLGPKLFNSVPSEIRNLTGVSKEVFKTHLDKYLSLLPDHPAVAGLYPAPTNSITGKSSNSIADWAQYLGLTNRRSTLT